MFVTKVAAERMVRRMRTSPVGATCLVFVVLAGCGSSSSTTTTTSTTAHSETGHSETGHSETGHSETGHSETGQSEAALYPAPEHPWAELDHQARAQHMSRHVVPAMGELFEGYDEERFGSFGCATCHGPDARERHFAMPSPSLPVLYPTGSIGQHRAVAEFPEGVRFMYSQVTPAMRQLLGAPEFDEATHEGFTCFACHTRAADDDPLSQPE